MPMREARVIALAGVFQGCRLVHDLATSGKADAASARIEPGQHLPHRRRQRRRRVRRHFRRASWPRTADRAARRRLARHRADPARAERRAPRAPPRPQTSMRDALRTGIESIARQVAAHRRSYAGVQARLAAALLRNAFARAPARDRARKSCASGQSTRRRADPRNAARRRARGRALAPGRRRPVSPADPPSRVRDAGEGVARAVYAGSRVGFFSACGAGFVVPAWSGNPLRRHSGVGRNPLVSVIPAKAGIHSSVIPANAGIHFALFLSLVFGAIAKTDSRPCAFRPPSMAAGSLSFACPKESNQRKRTLGSAPLAQRAVRCGRTGFAHRPSMACVEIGAIHRAAPRFARLVRPPFAAAQRDPRARANDVSACRRHYAGLLRQGLPRFAFPGSPLGRGEQAQEKAQRGARTMRARSTRAHGCAPGEPRSLLAQSPGRMPGDRGREGVFLLVTSLWASKEK